MDTEGAFNLVLRRRALATVSMSADADGESEFSGTIGRIREVSVVDGVLLVIRGQVGCLRLVLPSTYLSALASHRSGSGPHGR